MTAVVVSGFAIPVAPGSVSRPRDDATDRARAFDLTYRASVTGNPKRDWHFSTPPIPRVNADFYETILGSVTAKTCSGELLIGNGNLLLRSEELDNAAWTKTATTVDADVITSPNGTVTADKLKETAATSQHNAIQGITGLIDNTVYTFSDFFYPAERTWITVGINGKDGVSRYTYFNLATGAKGTSVGSPTSSGIERAPGDAWWRAWVAATVASGGSGYGPQIGLATADGTNSYLGVAGNGVYAWGAQLELGSTPSAYTKTTTAAVTGSVSCCTEITDWQPVKTQDGHRVVLAYTLHEV